MERNRDSIPLLSQRSADRGLRPRLPSGLSAKLRFAFRPAAQKPYGVLELLDGESESIGTVANGSYGVEAHVRAIPRVPEIEKLVPAGRMERAADGEEPVRFEQ